MLGLLAIQPWTTYELARQMAVRAEVCDILEVVTSGWRHLVRGPDFELPPLDPPPPSVDSAGKEGPKAPPNRLAPVATLVAVLAISGVAAAAWVSTGGTSPPPTPVTTVPAATTRPAETPPASTSTTRLTTTTRVPRVATQACVESTESPGAAAGWAPDGFPWITFHVSPRAARDALARIAQDAAEARAALGDAGSLGVRLYCDVQELGAASGTPLDEVQKDVDAERFAWMSRGEIWLYGPLFEKELSSTQRQVVYHEYFHVVQRSLSRTRSLRDESPLWLIEGSAKYFEHTVMPRDLADFRRERIRRWGDLPALEALEQSGAAKSIGGTGDAYTVGSVAVDYLVTRYGRERIQSDFWAALAGTDWRAAFLQVFGVPVETFYAEFATYRQTLRP